MTLASISIVMTACRSSMLWKRLNQLGTQCVMLLSAGSRTTAATLCLCRYWLGLRRLLMLCTWCSACYLLLSPHGPSDVLRHSHSTHHQLKLELCHMHCLLFAYIRVIVAPQVASEWDSNLMSQDSISHPVFLIPLPRLRLYLTTVNVTLHLGIWLHPPNKIGLWSVKMKRLHVALKWKN